MFNVGANNPNVGNDRRKGVIDQLAQQLAQRFASSNAHNLGPGVGADQQGLSPFLDLMRKRQQQMQPGALAAAVRGPGAGRATAGTPILAGGPAAMPGRASAHVPAHVGGSGVNPVPTPHLNPAPAAPAAPTPNVGGTPSTGYNSGPSSGANINAGPVYPNGDPTTVSLPGQTNGWIPIGGGVFYDPVNGIVRGTPSLNPIDTKF